MSAYVRKYNPNRSSEWNYGGEKWKLSRSKIDAFIECPRCFYIDNKLGTKRPSTPAFTLNVAVDALFKSEFDAYRKKGEPHPLMIANHIDAVPFQHKDLETWRDPFEGITHFHKETGLLVSGAVDDLWLTRQGELIVVDYKATSKTEHITSLDDSGWGDQYARQVGVYQWLFAQNGFKVFPKAYFVYANGDASKPSFENTLHFETTVIPCEGDTRWIEPTLLRIKNVFSQTHFPRLANSANTVRIVRPAVRSYRHSMQSKRKQPKVFSDVVRDVVRTIPRGKTMSYKEVAEKAGNPKAARAVARVMAANYDPNIPCHRVICSNGSLGGYNRGGIEAKRKILFSEEVSIP